MKAGVSPLCVRTEATAAYKTDEIFMAIKIAYTTLQNSYSIAIICEDPARIFGLRSLQYNNRSEP